MEKFQVEMELPKEKCSVKRLLWIVFAICAVGCILLVVGYLLPKTIEFEHEIRSLNKENESYKRQINNVNHEIVIRINGSLRHFTNERMSHLIRNEIEQMKIGNRSEPNSGHDLLQSFNDMKDHLDALVETVGNVSPVILRMNNTELTISRLGSNLTDTKNDLIRLQSELTRLNKSVHTDITPSIISAVKDVRHELNTLRQSTTANVSDLWKYWNRTNAEIEDIIKLMAQQNETFHFKIAYHSDVLYSEVKDVEKKQLMSQNYTIRTFEEIRRKLNQTRDTLQQKFNNKITRVNKTWHKALENIDRSVRFSVEKINTKVDGIKQEFRTSITQVTNEQKGMKNDFSKTKADFQEKDRKHASEISKQGSEMKSMKKRIEDLEGKLNSKTRKMATLEKTVQDLKTKVNKMTNGANRVLGSYIPFFLVSIMYIIH